MERRQVKRDFFTDGAMAFGNILYACKLDTNRWDYISLSFLIFPNSVIYTEYVYRKVN